jgi:dynein heavy chain
MERATKAVACLEAKSIQELKALGSPPEACVVVAKAVLILKQGEKKNHAWPNAQKMMGNPKKFIDDIVAFDGDNIDDWKLHALEPILAEPFFNFETMKNKSIAAAYLCGWIVNIIIYN